MLLPCEDNKLRQTTLDRKSARIGRFDNLPTDIDFALKAVIEQELVILRDVELYRLSLAA